MPEQGKKNSLQEALAQKTTRELENMLVEDFAADAEPNAEKIHAIMEVMCDRNAPTEEEQKMTEAALKKFRAAIHDNTQPTPFPDADSQKERPSEHTCKNEPGQSPKKSFRRPLRYLLIAAAITVVVAGTAMGRNWFSVIARWTAETFHFNTGRISVEMPKVDALDRLKLFVEQKTDLPVVPCRAPAGTEMVGNISKTERTDSCKIHAVFTAGDREFSIRYTVYEELPGELTATYQKDANLKVTYPAGGTDHYIMENYDNLSVSWVNGTVEGHIQGELTLEELQGMLNSIYEE